MTDEQGVLFELPKKNPPPKVRYQEENKRCPNCGQNGVNFDKWEGLYVCSSCGEVDKRRTKNFVKRQT